MLLPRGQPTFDVMIALMANYRTARCCQAASLAERLQSLSLLCLQGGTGVIVSSGVGWWGGAGGGRRESRSPLFGFVKTSIARRASQDERLTFALIKAPQIFPLSLSRSTDLSEALSPARLY